jgi:uncharacterized RDD family membrane protein YckC
MKKMMLAYLVSIGATLSWAQVDSLTITQTVAPAIATDTTPITSPATTLKPVGDMIRIGSPGLLREDETCKDAVIIGNSATIRGKVQGDLVVVGGPAEVSNQVSGNLVIIGGSATLSPDVKIGGDFVVVGGKVIAPENLSVGGQRVEVASFLGGPFDAMHKYLSLCLFKARFISEQLPWTIALFGMFLIIGFVLSVLFQKSFHEATGIMLTKPGIALLIGMCTALAAGPAIIVLMATVIGIPATPVLIILLMGLGLIGNTAVLAATGRHITALFGRAEMPVTGQVLIGAVVAVALALIPWIGALVILLLVTFGTGAGTYAFFQRIRELQATNATRRSARASTPAAPTRPQPIAFTPDTAESAAPAAPVEPEAPVIPPTSDRRVEPEVLAEMWPRLGAVLIDTILVFILYNLTIGNLIGMCGDNNGAGRIVCLLIYLAAFWSWKGTTIGNIVFHLQVRRLDDSRITVGVAILRALSIILSVAPLGLGFFWIQWDPNRQAWHDTIAGTKVVRMPRSVPLI